MEKAIKQAKEFGATKYGIIFMSDDDKLKNNIYTDYKFIHFFNDNMIEIGYFTYSLKDFIDKIKIFDGGRVWDASFLEDLTNITKI